MILLKLYKKSNIPLHLQKYFDKYVELGLEPTPDLYIKHLCDIYDGIRRVLKDNGTCWVVIGDTYLPNKSLAGIPQRFMLEMINPNYVLRDDISEEERKCVISELIERKLI